MNGFEKFVNFLQVKAPKPAAFGWFHWIFIVLFIALTVFMCIKYKDNKKAIKIYLIVAWAIMFAFEIYKQLVFSFDSATHVWEYEWSSFPFSLCSTVLYITPIAIFVKEGHVKDACYSFLSYFAFFGGVITFLVPTTVFNTSLLGIQIQTMVHHGLMITMGALLMCHNRKKANWFYFLKGLIVFAIVVLIAIILNETMIFIPGADGFNMMEISRHDRCVLPLLNTIYDALMPNLYVIFLAIYIIGFGVVGLIFFGINHLGIFIAKKVIELKAKKKVAIADNAEAAASVNYVASAAKDEDSQVEQKTEKEKAQQKQRKTQKPPTNKNAKKE